MSWDICQLCGEITHRLPDQLQGQWIGKSIQVQKSTLLHGGGARKALAQTVSDLAAFRAGKLRAAAQRPKG